MNAASVPLSSSQPKLVMQQPLARPRHDRVRNEILAVVKFVSVVEAQSVTWVNVWQGLVRSSFQRRGKYDHARDLSPPVDDAEGVSNAGWRRLQLPGPDDVVVVEPHCRVRVKAAKREQLLDGAKAPSTAWRGHRRSYGSSGLCWLRSWRGRR